MQNGASIEQRVLMILLDRPETRYDDMLLTLEYYRRHSPMVLSRRSFEEVMLTYREYGLPCFESIRRARQRIQADCQEVSRHTQKARKNREPIVINIFIEVNYGT